MKRALSIAALLLAAFCTSPLGAANVVQYKATHQSLLLPDGMHLLGAKAIDGTKLELENGAQFQIHSSDTAIVLDWDTTAPLVISPNPYPCSGTDFFITNEHTKEYVHANFTLGPVITDDLTNTILHIDHHYGEIHLVTGTGHQTCWEVDSRDLSYIRGWEKGETVIIGHNHSFFTHLFSNCEFILISYPNLKRVKYVRANQKSI